jgi:hypothetical protein
VIAIVANVSYSREVKGTYAPGGPGATLAEPLRTLRDVVRFSSITVFYCF